MSGSFFIPLGALVANSTALSMVGNNLANLNTTGYKASSASFSDLVSQQIGSGGALSQVGMGVADPLIRHQFLQGTIQSTSGPLDAAIQGGGFFIVRDVSGMTAYTRAGNFSIDAAGNLVNASGQFVQGWSATGGVVSPNGAVGNIVIPSGALQSPIPTSQFSLNLNLDASAATNGTFSTPIQIVDSLGTTHTLTVTFTKTGPGAWSYDVTIPGQDIKGGTAGTPSSLATGNVTFDSAGKLLTPAPPPPAANGVVAIKLNNLADGAANQTMNWNLYNPDLTATMTQFAQASAASGSSQDGIVAAQPVKIQLGAGGTIMAQYSNGKSLAIAQVALAAIRNPDSMIAIGDNDFVVGAGTVTPSVGAADTGGRGKIVSSALEASTVDIAKEFTDLMVYQRSYQADSKVITTLDELSQDTINIKR